MRLKILLAFIFFAVGVGLKSYAQNSNTVQFSHVLPPDTLNLNVKMLDSIKLCFLTLNPINYGYYRFQVVSGEDPMLFGETINVYLGKFDFFKFDSLLTLGWTVNIRVIRSWPSYRPYVFYELEYIYAPGEIFITSHKSFGFR